MPTQIISVPAILYIVNCSLNSSMPAKLQARTTIPLLIVVAKPIEIFSKDLVYNNAEMEAERKPSPII